MRKHDTVSNRIINRMTAYGAILGVFSGAIVLFFMSLSIDMVFAHALITACTIGAFFGAIFGLSAGFVNGVFLANALPRLLRLSNILFIRIGFGTVTAMLTAIVFTPLFIVATDPFFFRRIASQIDDMFAGLIFSIGLSVYACQRVITKYLREIDLRKAKG